MDAGRIIKLLRDAENIPQDDLANDLGVTRGYLSQVENGREPSLTFLKAVSSRLAVPLPLLLADDSSGDPELVRELRKLVETLLAARISLWSGSSTGHSHE